MKSPTQHAEPWTIPAGRTVEGQVEVPPSKSITQRYLALALIGRLSLGLERPLVAEDPMLFQAALGACGFDVRSIPGAVMIDPPANGVRSSEIIDIFCGNGGTMCRLLTAALTVVPGRFRLGGVARLHERPIGPLVDALRPLGAEIEYLEREGFPPLTLVGDTLVGGETRLDASASSQYLSALLLAGQAARAPIEVTVDELASSPYVALTIDAIRHLGGHVEADAERRRFRTEPRELAGGTVAIEGDFSAAAYPAAAAALAGGRVSIDRLRVDSAQGDRGFLEILADMGAPVGWHGPRLEVGRAPRLRPVEVNLGSMPDQVPTLAALAPFAHGRTVISGVAHLRIKESDRLSAMARELGRLGVPVSEREDGLAIDGIWAQESPPSEPVTVRTYGDHRIAMALALVGLRRPAVTIDAPDVVDKSYPRFFDDLRLLIDA